MSSAGATEVSLVPPDYSPDPDLIVLPLLSMEVMAAMGGGDLSIDELRAVLGGNRFVPWIVEYCGEGRLIKMALIPADWRGRIEIVIDGCVSFRGALQDHRSHSFRLRHDGDTVVLEATSGDVSLVAVPTRPPVILRRSF